MKKQIEINGDSELAGVLVALLSMMKKDEGGRPCIAFSISNDFKQLMIALAGDTSEDTEPTIAMYPLGIILDTIDAGCGDDILKDLITAQWRKRSGNTETMRHIDIDQEARS